MSNNSVQGELGLRVYLSSKPDFDLEFFKQNDQFRVVESESDSIDETIRNGQSFLLWSEDNALEATKSFSSRSFVLVGSDDPSSPSSKISLDFANKFLEDSIQHEKQLQSDGGGLMAAVNSAGGGIESTSVLLTLYKSATSNFKNLMASIFGDGDSGKSSTQSSQNEQDLADEPKSIVKISPNNPVWKSIMSNGDAYVHVLLVRQTPSSSSSHQPSHLISSSPDVQSASRYLQSMHKQHNVLFGKVGMIKRELPLHVPSPKRLLYHDILYVLKKYLVCPIADADGRCSKMVPPWNVQHHQTQAHEEYALAQEHKKEGVKYPYWKPEVRIHLVQDSEAYPVDYAGSVGFEIIRPSKRTGSGGRNHASGYAYLPSVHVDEIGLTSDKYIPLNETVSALPLRIGFNGGIATDNEGEISTQEGLTPARYRLLNHLSSSLESQAEMGFEQSDIDDLRRLIAETNVMLLAVTILASVFHLLFELLTFKSDVDFWRGNTDLTGLSVRALFLDWASQVVILLYLIEMDSSLLMTVPTAIGVLIALWKCQRGSGLKLVKSSEVKATKCEQGRFNTLLGALCGYELSATRLRSVDSSSEKSTQASDKPDLAALTEEMDQLATRLLGKYFLLPLVVSFAIYSLTNELHSGWYSWFITTASSFVYAIGFVLMTPQLFLNYKLKSVAHLPWRVLGYRFVNTFIDDLFAFIIRM